MSFQIIYFEYISMEKLLHLAFFYYNVSNVDEWRNAKRNDVRWTEI